LAINLGEASGGPNGCFRGGHQLADGNRGVALALALAYSFIHSFIRSTFRQSIKLARLELAQMGGKWAVDGDQGSVFIGIHQYMSMDQKEYKPFK